MHSSVSKRGRPRSTGARVRGTRGVAGRRVNFSSFSTTSASPADHFSADFNNLVSGSSTPNESENDDLISSDFWSSGALGSSKDYLQTFGGLSSSENLALPGFSPCTSYDEKIFWDPVLEVPGMELECESTVTDMKVAPHVKSEPMDYTVYQDDGQFHFQSVKIEPEEVKPEVNEDVVTPAAEKQRMKQLSAYEEFQLMKRLEHSKVALTNSVQARRFLRKLQLRQTRRVNGLPQFEFDKVVKRLAGDTVAGGDSEGVGDEKQVDSRVLDRFQTKSSAGLFSRENTTFRARLLGCDEEKQRTFVSPYTRKTLKTVIWRDSEARPLKLRLLQGILSAHLNKGKRGGDHPCSFIPEEAPVGCIEYQYVRPHHVPAINSLAREFFWPGIEVSECLQYPDYTCVALYKKIVVGFAIMVPDVGFNEAYISFLFTHPEWRNAGISTFMVYHLIQTSLGKDITLHVEATNPAVFLYQKFCFKIEEFLVDFYDKYLPVNSTQCKHALFMRLSR